MTIDSVLLAAGHGTRMRSKLHKVLHPLAGQPMIWHSLQALKAAGSQDPVVVVGHQAEAVRQAIGSEVQFALQEEQLGTGHAVQQAEGMLRGKGDLVLVTFADMPLVTGETLQKLIDRQKSNDGPFTMLTVIAQDPRGFGRVLRNADGHVMAIVEHAHATAEQLEIRELNASAYCFEADWLWDNLANISLSPKGEYYLTDLVEIAVKQGSTVAAVVLDDANEAIGINTRVHLAEAEAALRRRINNEWMLAGVTLMDPSTTYIEAGVRIGGDTVIYPNSSLQGETQIGAECSIGPNTMVRSSQIGDRCKVFASVVENAKLENDVDIGPYGHLRKGAHLADGVHMGNFGEVKNAYLGPGTKAGHFSYIGDATIGKNVNIGAGTITCNFDGEKKNHTEIEDDVFIGSDTMLVAPLKIEKGARSGAGSVITKNVPADTVVAGIPARAIRKLTKE
ncbi:MAG: bifunctional UDP-N-acetylglucosamine diphosphorylase/glucosamine-1-phosphate N-acetyltransferase GlmU [Anaerolineae bacterium]|nr:bifunctional UDP-N-acetylglucosamine diphosphorylase/glucosamine-1-phosphate N-acetyltransferase GlmU [Anaerolineae bacterium]